jgi:hypothetical protein
LFRRELLESSLVDTPEGKCKALAHVDHHYLAAL